MTFVTWLWELFTEEYQPPETPETAPDDDDWQIGAGDTSSSSSSSNFFGVGTGVPSGNQLKGSAYSGRTGPGTVTLTIKCIPKIKITYTDQNIRKVLDAIGYSTKDIE